MTDTGNIIDSATASTILKWAIGILITGFIAQFGKKFATYLIEKVKSIRKGKSQAGAGDGRESGHGEMTQHHKEQFTAASQAAAEKARLKLEKKKLKNRIKKEKKK